MRIPDASFDQALTIVNAKVNRLSPCPACGTNDWKLDQEIYEMPLYPGSATAFATPRQGRYPIVMVNCSNCGFLRTFSAIMLGLVKPDGSPVLA